MKNPRLTASALATLVCCSLMPGFFPQATGALTNRWSFNNATGNAPAGTAMADSISAATATVKGNNSTFNGSALTITGATTGNRSANLISGYVDLPNGIISSKTNLTVEIWATPISAKNQGRLFDFGRTTATTGFGPGSVAGEINEVVGTSPGSTTASDELELTFGNGTNYNQQRMEARLNTANIVTVNTALATALGTRCHYVFTFEDGVGAYGSSGGRMKWYRNGTLAGSGDIAFHLSALEDVNNWLGRSLWTADDNSNASYDELRIYNNALTAAAVSANFSFGPNNLGPPAPPPTPDHLWTFTEPASSTVASVANERCENWCCIHQTAAGLAFPSASCSRPVRCCSYERRARRCQEISQAKSACCRCYRALH